jgi:hypothetical protein
MEVLVALFFLFYGIGLMARMLLPGRIGDVFIGIVLRDCFWMTMRAIGFLISLPFRILTLLLYGSPTRGGRRARSPKWSRHRCSRGRSQRRR